MSENPQSQNRMGTARMLPLIFSMALPAMVGGFIEGL